MFGKKCICAGCGERVNPVKKKKGSWIIFCILLLLLVIPAIIYLLWMFSNREDICPKCKSSDVVKIKSPRGQKLLAEYK